jgi:glycosyltransferase involved in cell wall biosynthesis
LAFQVIFIEEHVRAATQYNDCAVLYLSPERPLRQRLAEVSRSVEHGLPVIRVRRRRFRSRMANRLLFGLLAWREVLRLRLSGFRPDIIHTHIFAESRFPIWVGRFLKIPVVVTEHWTALCREGVLSAERLRVAKSIYEAAAMVMPVCHYLECCIRERTKAKFRSRVVLNAVDTSVFYWKAREERRAERLRVLSVARLEEPKDIPTLLRAIWVLKTRGYRIDVEQIGKGDKRPMAELAAGLGLEGDVAFRGEQPKTAVAEAMRRADLLALSSLWENSPCVIGEAFCCGLPVVATAVGGVPELVAPNNGVLVSPADPDAFALGLAQVLDHSEAYDGRAISQRAQTRFSYEAIGAQLDEVYRTVVR